MTDPAKDATAAERTVLAAVRSALEAVYRDTGRPQRDVASDALLGTDLGLDSLDMAQVVVLLERSLGVDPFRDRAPTAPTGPVRTVRHLVALYAAAVGSAADSPH